MNMLYLNNNYLYLNNDYCYSLEDLRDIIKQCAIIGPELDNPLIIELLCALKDGSLKSFLEGGTLEEQTIANQLPDYTISKDDVELLNLLHQCFDNSYEMKKVSLSDYIDEQIRIIQNIDNLLEWMSEL